MTKNTPNDADESLDLIPIHVMPMHDLIEHAESYLCECLPVFERGNAFQADLYSHRLLCDPDEMHS